MPDLKGAGTDGGSYRPYKRKVIIEREEPTDGNTSDSSSVGAVRSMFLLRYLSDLIFGCDQHRDDEKRALQQVSSSGSRSAATTSSRENVRDEQRKFVKYTHLIANLLAFHNIVGITNAARRMEAGSSK
jgi:hypothetical protein